MLVKMILNKKSLEFVAFKYLVVTLQLRRRVLTASRIYALYQRFCDVLNKRVEIHKEFISSL